MGCYFCNDTVAPRNSVRDRTLDQQCTVSRPALSCIASSLGVELLSSLVNHPAKNKAISREEKDTCDKSPLGIIPQSIRGDLFTFDVNVMYGTSSPLCIGCSEKVVKMYLEDKHSFILNACDNPDFLEDVTGITEMMKKIDVDDVMCFDDFDEMFSDEDDKDNN
jgi:ubiquitin-like modifier-activating enzyme ATG7